jgi:translation initiation factor 2 alpha subunit (eIF-2alpha)
MSMCDFFQIYNNSYPELNETVLIKFTKKNESHFEGELVEYNYSAIMSYNDATKKKKVYSWNKVVPLHKIILAKIENINKELMFVQVSMAHNDNKTDIKDQLKPFFDTKILLSLIKKISYINKIDFNEFWKNIIHPIDKIRKEEEHENLLLYFKDNKKLLTTLVEEKYENHIEILNSINYNMLISNQKITSKIGLISMTGIENTKKTIYESIEDQTWNYSFKYESAPYYILESYTDDSSIEDHQMFIDTLTSIASKNKIFSKVEYIGKI